VFVTDLENRNEGSIVLLQHIALAELRLMPLQSSGVSKHQVQQQLDRIGIPVCAAPALVWQEGELKVVSQPKINVRGCLIVACFKCN
jgi:hypothetical protein